MQFEDYLLKYMLQWETRKSETMLNVEKISKPFDYCLHIYRDGETRVQKVDLPETFNYLIGLDVAKRQLLDNNGRYYLIYRGATREGKRTVVIWREPQVGQRKITNATVTLWPSTNLPRVRTLSMSTAIRSSPVLRRWKVCSRQKCLQAWRDRYGRSTLQEG